MLCQMHHSPDTFIKDILKKYYERELIISAYYENDDLSYEHFHVLCI